MTQLQLDHAAVMFGMIHDQHRRELAEMEARNLYYRALLSEHGVDVTDREDTLVTWNGDDHYNSCQRVVALAYDVVVAGIAGMEDLRAACERFRDELGTAGELIANWPTNRKEQ